jgi:hypothetical protein
MKEERSLRVLENRVLRIFGPKRDEVTGQWRKPHNEKLNDLYCSTTIVRDWRGNLRERDHLEDTGVEGRIILRWIFRKWDVGVWTRLSWLRVETVGGHL